MQFIYRNTVAGGMYIRATIHKVKLKFTVYTPISVFKVS